MPPRGDRRALAALLGGGASIAFVPILVRVSELGPHATAFWRLAIALPLLAALRRLRDRPASRVLTQRERALLAIAGVCFAGDLGTWHWSIRLTTIANATLLPNVSPLFVTLGAWLVFRERIRGRFLVGLAVALAGVSVLLRARGETEPIAAGAVHASLAGDALGLAAAVFYASYLLTVQRLRATVSTLTVMLGAGVASTAALGAFALVAGESFVPPTTAGWLVLLALGILHVAGQGLIGHALATLPATFLSVGLLIQPVGAALLAAWLFHEPLGVPQALGGALVVAGIALARPRS